MATTADTTLAIDNVLVVLPANEYFNDKCITDTRSALGAYVNSKFPGRAHKLEAEISSALRGRSYSTVIIDGLPQRAYGLGTVAYLDRALGENAHLLIAAATTERPGEGLKGDLAAIVQIVQESCSTARDRRLATVSMPLIGAGHGAIKPSRSLLLLLVSWAEVLYAHAGQRLAVNVVVFRQDASSEPDVRANEVHHLMATAIKVCKPTER
jgi:Domain of unknown function (DUF6430)